MLIYTHVFIRQASAALVCIPLSLCFLAKCDVVPLAGFNADYHYNS